MSCQFRLDVLPDTPVLVLTTGPGFDARNDLRSILDQAQVILEAVEAPGPLASWLGPKNHPHEKGSRRMVVALLAAIEEALAAMREGIGGGLD